MSRIGRSNNSMPTPRASDTGTLVRTLSGRNITNLQIGQYLNEGEQGTIEEGTAHDSREGNIPEKGNIDIIVKKPFPYSMQDYADEIKAAYILQQNGLRNHENIAYIYGETEGDNKAIVMKRYKNFENIFDIKTAKVAVKGIASATHAMLQKGIRHNDTHLGNILCEENKEGDYIAKIIDFGLLTQHKGNDIFGFIDYKKRYEFIKNTSGEDEKDAAYQAACSAFFCP